MSLFTAKIYRRKIPTLLVIAEKKNYDLEVFEDILHGISTALKLPTIIITQYKLPPSLTQRYPLVTTEKQLSCEILRKSDIGLMLDGNISQKTLDRFAESKVIPILPNSLPTHIYQNYDAVMETGNCFIFENLHNPWTIFTAIVRAVETYQFPYDWSNLIKSLNKPGK